MGGVDGVPSGGVGEGTTIVFPELSGTFGVSPVQLAKVNSNPIIRT